VQIDVPESQVKHVEFVHCIGTPPEIEYPSIAIIQNIVLDIEGTQAEHPDSHGTV
jgi:hypothetical protein